MRHTLPMPNAYVFSPELPYVLTFDDPIEAVRIALVDWLRRAAVLQFVSNTDRSTHLVNMAQVRTLRVAADDDVRERGLITASTRIPLTLDAVRFHKP
jgi:hypothetical protein